jgi:hypothetical protein
MQPDTPRHAPRPLALFALALGALTGCATAPGEPVTERLDERTGVTVTELERPLLLVATEVRGSNTDPFAALAPFETNVMGRRTVYLWVAYPDEKGTVSTPPSVAVDGTVLPLVEVGSGPRAVALKALPYEPLAPWSTVRLFRVDAMPLISLGRAAGLTLTVRYSDSQAIDFSGVVTPTGVLQDFVRRIQP